MIIHALAEKVPREMEPELEWDQREVYDKHSYGRSTAQPLTRSYAITATATVRND